METMAGYVAGLIVAEVRGEIEQFRREIHREIETAVRRGVRPALVSAVYLAHLSGISPKTVHRRCAERGIPKRDMHGHPKQEESGLTFYSLDEWEAAERLTTRTITNKLRRKDRR